MMIEKPARELDQERRRFFRIEDLIQMTWRRVDEKELAYKLEMLEKGLVEQFMVSSSLAAISAEMSATLRRIEVKEPDVAEYLKALDRKIDLIGQAFMVDENAEADMHATPVNLSASGIAFYTAEPLEEGIYLEIRMTLLPTTAGVLAYGRVIGNDAGETVDGPVNQVRVDFEHMRDEDRDMLIRHVIRKQGDMLRERRVARENSEDS